MSRPDPYAARHAFFAPARGAASVLGILGGLLLVELVWTFTSVALVPWASGETGTAFRTLAVHLSFLSIAAAIFVVVRQLQTRNPMELFGPWGEALRDFVRVSRNLLIFLVIYTLIPGSDWSGVTQAMSLPLWLLALPVACVAVLIQTGTEELLYRGYLMQSLGGQRDNALLWMGLPAALFGLSHYSSALPFETTLQHVIWTTAFGLAAADLTARTGNLGAAIGFHFCFNLPLVVLYAIPGEVSGFSLLAIPESLAREPRTVVSLALDLFYVWMLWMVCRISVRR